MNTLATLLRIASSGFLLMPYASSRVKPVPSSIPYSVRFPIMPEDTYFVRNLYVQTDRRRREHFSDLEPAMAECQGLEIESFPLRFPQWWRIGSSHGGWGVVAVSRGSFPQFS